MALFGSTMPGEVGLRLLLSPLGSNVVYRTACCSVGVVLPVYSTFRAIESKNRNEQQRWLIYWAAYGSFTIAEAFTDKLISWFPLYYHMKFAFLVWLQLPTVDGAKQLYVNHLRPFLLARQARLDQTMVFLNTEMARFLSGHRAEMEFAKRMIAKLFSLAKQAFGDPNQPVRRQDNLIEGSTQSRPGNAIEGPTSQVEDDLESEPENDE